MSNPHHFSLCVVMALCVASASVLAESAQEEAAKKFAKAGELLFENGKFDDALKQFMEAYSRFDPPTFVIPQVIWNVARCHEKLRNNTKALQFFGEFEKYASTPEMRLAVTSKIADIRARMLAQLTIRVEPRGAEVRADGKVVGTVPLRAALMLAPGPHVISVSAAGYRPREEMVELGPDEVRALTIKLQPALGEIAVGSEGGVVDEVVVAIDGAEAYRGALPTKLKVPVGRHSIRVTGNENMERIEQSVDVPDGGQVGLVAKVHPPVVAKAETPIPVVKEEVPPSETSALKAGLFWSGLGVAALGGVLNVVGYVQWKNADQSGGATYDELNTTMNSSRRMYYSAFVFYGVGAAAVVTSLFVGKGKHPLGFAAAPTSDGAVASVSVGW